MKFPCFDCCPSRVSGNIIATSPGGSCRVARILDRLDRRILDELQADARISNQELAKRVGLSPAPCWRRLRQLEEEGFISGYVTLLNGPAIGLAIQAYALVSLEHHHPESVRELDRVV